MTHFIHFLLEVGKYFVAFCQCFLKFLKPFRIESNLHSQGEKNELHQFHKAWLPHSCFHNNNKLYKSRRRHWALSYFTWLPTFQVSGRSQSPPKYCYFVMSQLFLDVWSLPTGLQLWWRQTLELKGMREELRSLVYMYVSFPLLPYLVKQAL